MRHLFSLAVIAIFIGLLASCRNNEEQSAEAEENRYGINFSDTSTIKMKGMVMAMGKIRLLIFSHCPQLSLTLQNIRI